MKYNNKIITRMSLLLIVYIFVISFVSASTIYCCERTNVGATCQSVKQEDVEAGFCDSGKMITETSCDSTNYCQTGTCIYANQGKCITTPKSTCEANGGLFYEQDKETLPQCQEGCCVIGSYNSLFITQTECRYYSTRLGRKYEFLSGITSETECLSQMNNDEMGACVSVDSLGSRNCVINTREECGGSEGVVIENVIKNETSSTTFYPGYLCSAAALHTNCIAQFTTGCAKETALSTADVYWYDSCGNKENMLYKIVSGKENDTVSYNNGKILKNTNDNFAGSCNYYAGFTCKAKETDGSAKILHECVSTGCTKDGYEYKNGESWCGTDINSTNLWMLSTGTFVDKSNLTSHGNGFDLVGQEYYLFTCSQGEITSNICGTGRNQICIQAKQEVDWGDKKINYNTAKCITNSPTSGCSSYTTEAACEGTVSAYCQWIAVDNDNILKTTDAVLTLYGTTIDFGNDENDGYCLPMYTVGDNSDSNCNSVSLSCDIEYSKSMWESVENFFKGWGKNYQPNSLEEEQYGIVSGGECDSDSFIEQANSICAAAGDCGFFANTEGVKSTSSNDLDGYTYNTQNYYNKTYDSHHNALSTWLNNKIRRRDQ